MSLIVFVGPSYIGKTFTIREWLLPQLMHRPGELVRVAPASGYDAALVHDCGDMALLGKGFPDAEVTGKLLVIDHHASGRPFGDVRLHFAGHDQAYDYRRELDLDMAVVRVRYEVDGVRFTRTMFASRPDNAILRSAPTVGRGLRQKD